MCCRNEHTRYISISSGFPTKNNWATNISKTLDLHNKVSDRYPMNLGKPVFGGNHLQPQTVWVREVCVRKRGVNWDCSGAGRGTTALRTCVHWEHQGPLQEGQRQVCRAQAMVRVRATAACWQCWSCQHALRPARWSLPQTCTLKPPEDNLHSKDGRRGAGEGARRLRRKRWQRRWECQSQKT